MVWLADYEAWGNTAKVIWREQAIEQMQVSQDELQPIRFQGQHFDTETGLHYNRFRYYDPDMGMFTTRDPIGLRGGDNVFAYAPNPTGWVDPLGLAMYTPGTELGIREKENKAAKYVKGTALNGRLKYEYENNLISSGYHYYDYSSLPIAQDTNTNYKKLLHSLYSVGGFPGQKEAYVAPNVSIYRVYLPRPVMGEDHIQTSCICTPNSNGRGQGLKNLTMDDHFLSPGWVQRTIVSKNGMLHIRTEGGGTGVAPRQNAIGVPEVWGSVDEIAVKDFKKK